MNHSLFLKVKIQQEIKVTLQNISFMSLPTIIIFMLEIHGYSKLYDSTEHLIQFLKEFITFLFFTDMFIYFIHRGLHHRFLYKHLHKIHHRWIIQHLLQVMHFNGFFIFVNFWTVSIHDGNYSVLKYLQPIINGAAHHNDHHQFYKYNYRQFFTLWDRLMNTFHSPHVYSEKKKNIN
ncbi:unnamed protein product [Rotaria sp. Silwood2]|nr:unnamed protein product [Rotaria sp. Silwood2]